MIKASAKEKFNHTAVSIGNFDGVHKAHVELIQKTNEEKGDLKSVVYTFSPHPFIALSKEIELITSEEKKEELIEITGVDILYKENCTKEFLEKSGEEFIKEVLVEKLGAKKVFVGYDFRFGKNGSCDVEFLKELSKKYGFTVTILDKKALGGTLIKSSEVRKFIKSGEIEKANELLGRAHSYSGVIEKGKALGRTFGYPTANIMPDENMILPKFGVYVTKTKVDGKVYPSISNVGINPTVEDGKKAKIETFILDFEGDLYGKSIEVSFLGMIREEKKFSSKEALFSQIEKDVKEAKKVFDKA